jgi:hypothetical protein
VNVVLSLGALVERSFGELDAVEPLNGASGEG